MSTATFARHARQLQDMLSFVSCGVIGEFAKSVCVSCHGAPLSCDADIFLLCWYSTRMCHVLHREATFSCHLFLRLYVSLVTRLYLQAGNVKFVDLFQEPGGRSKGCAIVEYETPQEAHTAIRELHDTELNGRMMFVREDREEVRTGWCAFE